MPVNEMLMAASLFLLAALATGIAGVFWVPGRTIVDAKFFAGIFAAFFLVALICFLVSWRYACPMPGKWFNFDCLQSLLFK